MAHQTLENYEEPNSSQIGYIVDVNVGHIEHFKFHEEHQVDYHLSKAGFLDQQEYLIRKQKENAMKKA